MLIKRLALALGLAFTSCCTSSIEAPSEPALHQVERFHCDTPDGDTYASYVRVGDAVITAEHVVDECSFSNASAYRDIDLAIITPGKLPSCRGPEVGEEVVFQGFPTTKRSGKPFEMMRARRFEETQGTVSEVDRTIHMINSRTGGIKTVIRHTFTEPIGHVRPGYSGGAVRSLDGEFLGIISTGSAEMRVGSFIPADVICEKMEELL